MGQLNPTRQEIIDAHKALQKLLVYALTWGDDTTSELYRELYGEVLAALPPLPRPTMADIDWDDNEHFLAEAENRAWGKVIMLFKKAKTGKILSLFHEDGEQCFVCLDPCDLAPTGRRYVLKEGE